MTTLLDHLVVTAPTLAAGAAWVEAHLGVMPQSGGAHAKMGTHNLLLRLGENVYLEVIAIDPEATAPSRSRWFDLDRLAVDAQPALGAWVARSNDVCATCADATETLGTIEAMTRGDLAWLITIAENGSVPLDGCAPLLIEWQGDTHPASRLPDLGLRLVALDVHHPEPDRLRTLFDTIALDAPIGIVRSERARLVATIATPQGLRVIASA